ncbi:MAG: hypothetical protein K0S09_2726 [Sphingobacteriaceae bacterium]|jgi:uncharacterized protein (DUF2249 family)|nr:hypothetical protein [Sphingobacteriaceae bacterium]
MSFGNEAIDRNTTIKTLLDVKEGLVIDALINLNKNFSKLKNPILRKLLAKRVSIADACKIAGCNIPDFLKTMQHIGFRLADEPGEAKTAEQTPFTPPPEHLVIEFDVRPILARNEDPLKAIVNKASQLKPGEYLKVINSFEPTPLITLLNRKGYQSYTSLEKPDLSITYFFKSQNQMEQDIAVGTFINTMANFDETLEKYRSKLKEIDVTHLEMPQPMHTILNEIKNLGPDQALFVHHKKIPVYLLPNLHDEGFEYLIHEEAPGKVSILIYKP